ncbi:hypothetical protein C0583_06660 [Candidatus Parcubacteria bacterium]|nr:MAG: hypothetical protein C0583_06660 [Candidatus Parcubacteria bacterium]
MERGNKRSNLLFLLLLLFLFCFSGCATPTGLRYNYGIFAVDQTISDSDGNVYDIYDDIKVPKDKKWLSLNLAVHNPDNLRLFIVIHDYDGEKISKKPLWNVEAFQEKPKSSVVKFSFSCPDRGYKNTLITEIVNDEGETLKELFPITYQFTN